MKDRNPESVILFVVKQPEFERIASKEILDEYITLLKRPKFCLPDTVAHKWLTMFTTLVTLVAVHNIVDFPRDQKDAKSLSCAVATNAECLITGDKDFTEAYKIVNTTVLSVTLFKEYVCAVW